MSKVICEVCGTAYPETALQCPICGCVRPAGVQGISSANEEAAPERKYEHVKGGRFSKNNVRKRNAGAQAGAYSAPTKASAPEKKPAPAKPVQNTPARRKKKKKKNDNTGLVVTILVLILLIIAVLVYGFVKFFVPSSKPEEIPETDPPAIVEEPTDPVVEEPADIPCLDIVLDTYEINLERAGDHIYLGVTLEPFDTTDELVLESADSSIAMAESDGRITAVRKGETVVTVTCGIVSVQCKVTVGMPKLELTLNRDELIFEKPGDSWSLYSGEIPSDDIEWSSDDETVATVADGVVTAVGDGVTTVYGNYKGQIQSCVVRCTFAQQITEVSGEVTGETTSEEIPTETQPASSEYSAPFSLKNLYGPNSKDVSLARGDTFELALVDSNGKHIKGVTWTVEGGSSCTVNDGTVKAVSSGNCTIVATYAGETYKCIVRVR